MKTLNYVIAQEPEPPNFHIWLLNVRDIAGGETAVSETVALSAWKRGVTPRTFVEFLQKRDRGGAL